MRTLFRFAILTLLAGVAASCSSTTDTPGTNNPPAVSDSVTFTQGASYTYNQDKIDTATSTTPEMRDSSNRDVVTSTVVATNASFFDRHGVTVIENSHSLGGTIDTTYIYQQGGNVYRYNYGLEALNANPAFTAVLGGTLSPGWVLQAKLTATQGAAWKAADTSVIIQYSGFNIPLQIIDSAFQQADTTVVVNAKTMTAKHVVHSVQAIATIGLPQTIASLKIDNYITSDEGTVLNVAHSFMLNVPGQVSTSIAGQYTVMTMFK